ncbi:MAG: anaerobic glycerol-3-phosphate dehydrogenase subunit C [Planctomycetota bacterium]
MDSERSRIEEDLRGVVEGDVRCDDTFLQMYASDASIYEAKPLAVVMPVKTEDVVQCVQYAAENQIPIIPRGAASNVIGGCVGEGIVIDFSRSMRRIESVGRESITVEPGAVLTQVNRELAFHGRRFGPDPATRRVSTIGGTLSLNLTGSKWMKYGSPRDRVLELEVVLANGQVVKLDSRLSNSGSSESSAAHLESKVESIVNRYRETIKQRTPKTKINQSGYNLFDCVRDDQVDLTRLITGSEGTLAIITKAKLLTDPQPRHRGVALLCFDQVEKATQAAVEILKLGIVACDLIDRRLLTLAGETNQEFLRLIPSDAESVLLVEIQADDHVTLQKLLDHLKHRILHRKKLAFEIRNATQKSERDLFWKLTRRIIPTLYRLRGNKRALTFVDDIAVDPDVLPKFMKLLHLTLNEFEVTASIFAHIPQGIINVRPFLDLASSEDRRKMQRLSDALFDRVMEFGGSVSGSCGDGLSRSWYLRRQYGDLFDAFRAVKRTFDPQTILNPGKKIGENVQRVAENLRAVSLYTPPVTEAQEDEEDKTELPVIETQLNWSLEDLTIASRNCNGCGRCRSSLIEERMCPVFRNVPHEEASPRAKANLMRALVTGQLDREQIFTEEFKGIADLCFNCHQCRIDCPASVDVPKLMVEAKANYYSVNGLRFSDWLLTRLDWFYEIAGRMPRFANFIITNPTARALLQRFLGIASGRKLPKFSLQNFSRWANQKKLRRTSKQQSRKICYFVDAYVAWNDTELGQALVKVLKHNGIDVVIPLKQSVSGMSLISEGALKPAKKIAARNIETLSEYVRQGYQVITTEPSAALALKHEYRNLLDDKDVELVAQNTTDACSLLLNIHQSGELELDFSPQNVQVGYHLPCHQRVFTREPPAVKLLGLIPGLQVDLIEKGCSGMAGTWGLKSKNYVQSLKMGFDLINAVRDSTIIAGTTECSTCKIQMEQGTVKPTIHPIKILAKAYGLMPELENLFHRRSEELVTS